MTDCDVIVVGGGNAALCAALSARQAGARVILLERAPIERRGGNSAFTGGALCRSPVATLLHQHIKFGAVLVDRSPQRIRLTAQRHEHLI